MAKELEKSNKQDKKNQEEFISRLLVRHFDTATSGALTAMKIKKNGSFSSSSTVMFTRAVWQESMLPYLRP